MRYDFPRRSTAGMRLNCASSFEKRRNDENCQIDVMSGQMLERKPVINQAE
jgi:hypothetical protein